MQIASVSVIIPCYRCAGTVERAVASVANQTVRPAELILVDDGSGDQTATLLLQLQLLYGEDWVRVLILPYNLGVSAARNAGWESASSDFVAFLDADDCWHPEKIAIQYAWMSENPDVAVTGHGCIIVDPCGSLALERVQGAVAAREILPKALLFSNPFVTPSFMMKQSLGHRFDPSRRYAEDFFLLQQVALDGLRIVKLDAPLVCVFKKLGVSGASSNLWRMRCGDISNYWSLWQEGKIGLVAAGSLAAFSLLKFAVLLVVGGKAHHFCANLLGIVLRRWGRKGNQ